MLIDQNGTRFHLLLGAEDWGRCRDEHGRRLRGRMFGASRARNGDVGWDERRSELTLQPHLFEFPTAATDRPPALGDRRGAAPDRFGSWYWIAESGTELLVRSSGTRVTSHFWSAADEERRPHDARSGDFDVAQPLALPRTIELAGLAVTRDHYLVVGSVDPAGLLVFDLQAGGAPHLVAWPAGVAFRPFDLAARPGGGVFVLDRDGDRRSLWELARHLLVVPRAHDPAPERPGFEPAGDEPARGPRSPLARGLVAEDAWPLDGDPIAIAAAPDGSVVVLDRNPERRFSLLRRYDAGAQVGDPVATRDTDIHVDVSGYDVALVSPAHPGDLARLFVAGAEGNQAYAFDLSLDGDAFRARLARTYFPMRLFRGKGLASDGDRAYYDFGDAWIPLVEQRRTRYAESATVVTPAFDSAEPGCVWHRLRIEACLPPETRIDVWSRAAEETEILELEDWSAEPSLMLRPAGADRPFDRWDADTPYATWELLFQRARGRYLQAKLVLSGDGRTTPRVRALRATYPRFSYLERYLPRVYREDDASASFLDRFLANFEGTWTELEDRIAAAQVLFDPQTAPRETLDWLASWFDVALDPAWSEDRRRLFIAHALEFFQMRGTIHGVELALRLAHGQDADASVFSQPPTGPHRYAARIVERYRTRLTPALVLGDPTEAEGVRIDAIRDRWTPSAGAQALHDRYRATTEGAHTEYTLSPPATPGAAATWRRFSLDALGFVPSASPLDAERWRKFLESRYGSIVRLNDAYGSAYRRFRDVPLAASLPTAAGPLRDWYQLEATLLPMTRAAHRFTILLPVPTAAEGRLDLDAPERRRQLELTRRIVELEKPAHTVFDVRFFWSAFRLGEARLGDDTTIDFGSRASALVSPAVLGHGYVGEVTVADARPRDLPPRPRLCS